MWAKPKAVKEAEQLQMSPALQGLCPLLSPWSGEQWLRVDDPFSNPLLDQQVTSSLSLFPQTPEVMREEEKPMFFRQNLLVFERVVVCLWMMLTPVWYFLSICFWFFPFMIQTVVEKGRRNIFSMQWLLNVSLTIKKKKIIPFLTNKPHLLELKPSFKGCKKVKCCRIK